jgi:hypothetical protein
MKKLIVIALFLSGAVFAQQKEYKHSLQGVTKVYIESNTSVNVIASSTSQLVIKQSSKKNKEHHWGNHEEDQSKKDKKKGLRPIYPGGEDNTNGFGFSISKDGTTLIVRDLKSQFQRHGGLEINLPKTMNISVDAGNLGGIKLSGFTAEVEAETNVGAIKMNNVTGPITVHTSVGAINIDFDTVSQSSPITISSSVSEIDVSIPGNTKADLELRTQGAVYTNFDFPAPPKKGLKRVSPTKSIKASINGGGVKIKIKSSMGTIYLRKK